MNYQTDATFVIDFLNGQVSARDIYTTLDAEGIALSILTYMELWEGVEGNQDPRAAAQALRRFLRGVTILPFSRRVARRAAHLRREPRRMRRPIEQRALDILIAATALEYDLVMVTSDTDYQDIPGLKLLDPRAPQQ